MGILQQEYYSGLPCPPPGNLPNRGIESRYPALQVDSLLSEPLGKHATWLAYPTTTKQDTSLKYSANVMTAKGNLNVYNLGRKRSQAATGPQQQERMNFFRFGDPIWSQLQWLLDKEFNCSILGQIANLNQYILFLLLIEWGWNYVRTNSKEKEICGSDQDYVHWIHLALLCKHMHFPNLTFLMPNILANCILWFMGQDLSFINLFVIILIMYFLISTIKHLPLLHL